MSKYTEIMYTYNSALTAIHYESNWDIWLGSDKDWSHDPLHNNRYDYNRLAFIWFVAKPSLV